MNGHFFKKKKKKEIQEPKIIFLFIKKKGKIHLSNIGRGKLNGRKKKKNKQTNMLSTWVVSILVQNFVPIFNPIFFSF